MTALRCLLGRHAPGPKPITNHGFRFSTCRRCGKDIVQTIVGGWHVPNKAFQIVWRETGVKAAPAAPAAVKVSPKPQPLPDFMASDDDGFDWLADASPRSGAHGSGTDDRGSARLGRKRF